MTEKYYSMDPPCPDTKPSLPGPPPASAAPEAIAIIALSGRYPKAPDLDAFWDNLRHGVDCIGEVPAERWDWAAWFDPDRANRGKSHCNWGGFIEGIDQFDPLFFNIAPRDAVAMNPQERLALETAWVLFENAGYTRAMLRESGGNCGVYVGAMSQRYGRERDGHGPGEGPMVGPSISVIANRISHFFHLSGPSIVVDTMCSSSATAIHMACQDLLSGETRMAVAAGVNLSVDPYKYVFLSHAQVLGTHPDSRSFSVGDGYLPAEGVGAVLLKRLSDAIADGDTIHALIKGTAAAHAGGASPYMVPNTQSQVALIRACLGKAGAAPASISYIEAAANGSPLGDATELAALKRVFRDGGARHVLGSVKSNIGHPEAVSGMAQLTKVALQLKHRLLVPTVGAAALNPHLRLDKSPFILQREPLPWPRQRDGTGARRALINSFGAGGSGVSMVLEEFLAPAAPAQRADAAPHLMVFSAKSLAQLRTLAGAMLAHIAAQDGLNLADLAYTLQERREAAELRLALLVSDRAELVKGLRAYLAAAGHGGEVLADVPLFASDAATAPGRMVQLLDLGGGEHLVQHLFERRNYVGLALYWVQGGRVDWRRLHGRRGRVMLALPGHPFARQRCWRDIAGAPPPRRSGEPSPLSPALLGALESFQRGEVDMDVVKRAIERELAA